MSKKSGEESPHVTFTFDILHWLFEAQDNDVTSKLLESSNIELIENSEVTPFDCFVLGYCVSHINCTSWRIVLFECHQIQDEEMEMLMRGAVEEETHCTGRISEISLNGNGITSQGVKHLLSLPKYLIDKLETLDLSSNKLDSKFLAHLMPHMPHLKKLTLSNNPNFGKRGAVPFMKSLTARNSLETLFLDRTGLLPEAVELIICGLHHNTTLERLYMSSSRFSLQNTVTLAEVLRANHTLVHLCLQHCNIGSDGASHLANALCTNDTLQILDLGYNPIGFEGVTAFAELLLKNESLKELSLLDDYIGEEGTWKLIDSLTHNTTLERLWLHGMYRSFIDTHRVDSRVKFNILTQPF